MHHNQIICNPSCRKHVCLCVCEGEMVNFFTPQLPSLQSLQCVQDKGFHTFVKQNLIHSNCKRKNQDSYTTNIATFSFILKLRYATIERFNKTKGRDDVAEFSQITIQIQCKVTTSTNC